jgi:hypothetical protein
MTALVCQRFLRVMIDLEGKGRRFDRSRSPMARSATSSLSTSERKPCSSNFTGIGGNTTNTPSARNNPSAASTWIWGLKVTRSFRRLIQGSTRN